ncbi:protein DETOXIFICATION 14-like isoform X2 [Juglans microcarpa x Juglans regia]|uniref:protein DETOXIFICATION 14-like isoform X2 n=1 Tax=Juglans microcarpa x Juglans regia TaxID=2249226 RepID=UPI001B7F1C5A|nr:protein DETOXIFICATION 14-like isoform X2 [Juglans microcarpa x Juglans regia]
MWGKWTAVVKELKIVSYVAAPMVVVTVLQYLLQVVSVIMVGHLDDLSLSGVSIATSFTSVTGFSLLFGMAGALETLCGQAYGAEQYQKLGIYTHTAIISLVLICIPISLLWLFTDKLLILAGQDHSISLVAHKYSVWLIPGLFSYGILQSIVRYLQTQSMILPMLFSSFATLCFHVPICWALVFRVKLGSIGAALAICLSSWFNVLLLGLYMKYSSACEKTRAEFSKDVFLGMREFFRFAIPSAGMVCLEWWSYEVLILLSGLLPNPKMETSVLSICSTITCLHYYVPYAFGATARVSNELGAGNPQAAKVAVKAIMVIAVAEMVIVSMMLFFCRNFLGYAFSKEKEIVGNVADMGPFISLSIITDGLQVVLSGVARGSGWQHLGAYVNLGAYYLVGTPIGAVLTFALHFRGKGLWIGLLTGSSVQAILLALRTSFTNWQKQVFNTKNSSSLHGYCTLLSIISRLV